MKRLLVCLLLSLVVGCGESDADKAEAEYNKGGTFADRGDLATAIACFTEAIRINPDYADAYLIRGMVYYDVGDHDKAIADCTENKPRLCRCLPRPGRYPCQAGRQGKSRRRLRQGKRARLRAAGRRRVTPDHLHHSVLHALG